ncbi:MAG: Peptidase M23 [Candidatus Gottesmanbacteria bacterium GW2011_GWB1_43_11]|uniref:Peptidase M23 n=1 Tax=Candidatus Gottesmanbacteria bacterium GW2011_GWB1_43_11 TaxID=1618446 RepID=A0A0G1FDT5_9BACT|nr:MAG: Peptidase M23 [Candidatus Gottesmanbacteria bacterium GW2011_GWA2_42_16]KKS54006.1 MAG: Peptidase M23 [Candidatus Gottesmanbacteria bacterium GW2011_GWA1_42_26]KKS80650.1 MAG: Peptidase M23 [Candidatus Gottesmanbacteria bacterium GW2011_GWC1_43_10]KKS85008.1 MAG: Peptidase M23 [Candidatus Gottesmanbacteria bacterium GW2011_GWB1_43_11]HCM38327.1 hypothetical protein [Patescibacteria group bacterium]
MVSMFRKTLISFFRPHRGRHWLSFAASKIFEHPSIKHLFGLNLLAAVIFTGVITPEANNLMTQNLLESKSGQTPIVADPNTKTTFEIPLVNFRISQFYSFWHPALDMVAEKGTPIYAIEDGIVTEAAAFFFGYGKHVVIAHPHGIKSLYAHMSEIDTEVGRRVTRGQLIGKVGATGWATGNHLHFEISQNDALLNPLDVLPIDPNTVPIDGSLLTKKITTTSSN